MSGMKVSQELLGLEVRTRGKPWRLFLGKLTRRLVPAFHLHQPVASLFGRSVKVSVMGKTLYLDLRDEAVCSHVYTQGIWEPEETEFVKKTLRPGMVFVDIGAHVGYFTVIASEMVGSSGKVFAFEPDPGNFSLLERNVGANRCQNVVVEQKGVAAFFGELLLYRSAHNFGDHRLYEPPEGTSGPPGDRRSITTVRTTSLDAYFERTPTRVDFVKVDIQGSEYAAFGGMLRVLRDNPDIIVLCEFWPKGLREAGATPGSLLEQVRGCAFDIYRLGQDGPYAVSDAEILQSVFGEAYTSLVFSRRKLARWGAAGSFNK